MHYCHMCTDRLTFVSLSDDAGLCHGERQGEGQGAVAAGCRAAHLDELQGTPRPPLPGAQLPARSCRRQGQAQGASVPLLQPLLQAPPLARPRGAPEVLREDHCPAPHCRSARGELRHGLFTIADC